MNTESTILQVMTRINQRRSFHNRISIAMHSLLSAGALFAIFPAYRYMAAHAIASGFSTYLSLLASDGSALAHSWQSLGLTLVESAPIAGAALMLAILLVLAYSARKTLGDLGMMKTGMQGS